MAQLDAATRAKLPNSAFAYIDPQGRRRLPIHDEAHVRNALAEFAAGDVGLSTMLPTFSKLASAPTRVGEYLAAGMPVAALAGVGDLDRLLPDAKVGIVLTMSMIMMTALSLTNQIDSFADLPGKAVGVFTGTSTPKLASKHSVSLNGTRFGSGRSGPYHLTNHSTRSRSFGVTLPSSRA